MDKIKTKKWKAIGLVAITLLVCAGVILTIVLVDRAEHKNYQKVDINELFVTDTAEYRVKEINYIKDETIELKEDEILLEVVVNVKAKAAIKINHKAFKLNGDNSVANDFGGNMTLKTNESRDITLKYIVEKDSNKELYLRFYGCQVPIGGTIGRN